MGIYQEKHINPYLAGLLVLVTTLIIFLPWMTSDRELFRIEGLFATEAREFNFQNPVVTAHNVAIRNAYPLFPALVATLERTTHIPMESALRIISFVMFLFSSIVVYFGAKSAKNHTSGIVACALYLSSFFAMEKVIDGRKYEVNIQFQKNNITVFDLIMTEIDNKIREEQKNARETNNNEIRRSLLQTI